MASLFTAGEFCEVTPTGAPLAGGLLHTYYAGTLDPAPTYTTKALSVANTNPVELDAYGRASVWMDNFAYRMVLADADDVTIWDQDAVTSPPFPPLGDGSGTETQAVAFAHYPLSNVAQSHVLTPVSPAVGDWFLVTPINGLTTNFITYTADKIHSLAENMTLDNANVTYGLRYINATVGWRLY